MTPMQLGRSYTKEDVGQQAGTPEELRLNEGGPVQDHIRQMTELFQSLAEMDSPLTEEDKVVYLLASLPDSFGVLVTALEASPDVPTMDVVNERLFAPGAKVE